MLVIISVAATGVAKEAIIENNKKESKEQNCCFKSPAELKEQLVNVVGQEDAKRILCTAIWKKLKYVNSRKSNIMLVGPSGSGKTYIVQSIAKLLGIPIVIVDASALTETGYHGNDIEDIFSQLLVSAGYEISLAEQGIVVLDEIDKKESKDYLEFDPCGLGVQHNMLRMLEDGVITLKNGVSLRTDNIMFVACGAFQKVENIIRAKQVKKQGSKGQSVGMNLVCSTNNTDSKSSDNSPMNITREDILKYGGLIPEFVGRFDMVVNLKSLGEEELLQMLKSHKNGVLKEYIDLFKLNGFELRMSEDLLMQIVKQSVAEGLGARGLRNILDKLLLYPLYSAASISKETCSSLITLELSSENIQGGHFPFIQGFEYRRRRRIV